MVHVPLNHRESRRFATVDLVLEPRRERRLREALLLQDAPNLEIGVDPFVEPPKKLEHEPFSISDRRIALIGAEPSRVAPRILRSAELSEVAGERGDHFAVLALHPASSIEHVE